MEDMSESDLLPKNMIKVPEVYIFTILSIIIWKIGEGRRWRRGGEGRREEGKWRGGEGSRWREYIFIVLSQCLSVFADL